MLSRTKLVCGLGAAAAIILAAAAASAQGPSGAKKVFSDYRGVSIGMTADEARIKLGNPADKSDTQDMFSFPGDESASVYYDAAKKVFAVSIMYSGKTAPVATDILGEAADTKPDGSLFKMLRFPKAGYFVSFSRTAGSDAVTIIAMQRIGQ